MTEQPAVAFLCQASASIGLGHLVRSRTFAAELRRCGQRCVMFGPETAYRTSADEALFSDWVAAPPRTSSEGAAAAFIEVASAHGAVRAVIDDYGADETFQGVLADAGLTWMQHFDASRPMRFRADILVHGSPAETEERWRPYALNPAAELLFGPRYCVLRPEFLPRQSRENERNVEQVLVSFGGGDDKGAILLTLEALVGRFPELRFAVMSGAINPNNPAIESWIGDQGRCRVSLYVQPDDVAGLFARSDLAILGGGTSIYEAASCGLPMVLVALADNQLRQCEGWERLGAAVFAGPVGEISRQQLEQTVSALLADRLKRARMAAIGRDAVDGRGAARLAAHLLKAGRK